MTSLWECLDSYEVLKEEVLKKASNEDVNASSILDTLATKMGTLVVSEETSKRINFIFLAFLLFEQERTSARNFHISFGNKKTVFH